MIEDRLSLQLVRLLSSSPKGGQLAIRQFGPAGDSWILMGESLAFAVSMSRKICPQGLDHRPLHFAWLFQNEIF